MDTETPKLAPLLASDMVTFTNRGTMKASPAIAEMTESWTGRLDPDVYGDAQRCTCLGRALSRTRVARLGRRDGD